MTKTIFVAGATGLQGGAVARRLISNHPSPKIHALVRDPTSPASQTLKSLSPSIKLFTGTFDDLPSILAATQSCTAAFLNVTPVFTDPTAEARHAQNLVSACIQTRISRLVYSSSGAMQAPPTDLVWTEFIPNNPHDWMTVYMTSKKACEDAVTASQIDWCILRGGTFFTNLLPPHGVFMYPHLASERRITTALAPDYVATYLDPAGLGAFAADALMSDDQTWNGFRGRALPFGVQNLTFGEYISAANDVLEAAGERKIEVVQLTEGEAEVRAAKGDIFVASQLFQNRYHRAFTGDELKEAGVEIDKMKTAKEFFEGRAKDLVAAVGGL